MSNNKTSQHNTVVANTSTRTSVLQARNNNNSGGTIKSTHQCIDNHHNIKDNNITLNQPNVGRDEECSSPYTSNARASRLITTDVQQPTVTNKQPVADHCYIRTNTDEQAGTWYTCGHYTRNGLKQSTVELIVNDVMPQFKGWCFWTKGDQQQRVWRRSPREMSE